MRTHSDCLVRITTDTYYLWSSQVFDKSLPNALLKALSAEPDAFFARITHESDHFDEAELLEEATETCHSFSTHIRAVEKGSGVVAVQDSLKGYREGMRGALAATSVRRRLLQ